MFEPHGRNGFRKKYLCLYHMVEVAGECAGQPENVAVLLLCVPVVKCALVYRVVYQTVQCTVVI